MVPHRVALQAHVAVAGSGWQLNAAFLAHRRAGFGNALNYKVTMIPDSSLKKISTDHRSF